MSCSAELSMKKGPGNAHRSGDINKAVYKSKHWRDALFILVYTVHVSVYGFPV